MSDHFNELLLQTIQEVSVRLERLEGRADHIINEKADKTDLKDVKAELNAVTTKLDLKADQTYVKDVKTELKNYINDVKAELKDDINGVKTELNELRDDLRSQGQRIDRIETGIRTLQWTMTAGLAVLGIIIAFIRVF